MQTKPNKESLVDRITKTDIVIYETKDYKMFQIIPSNRQLYPNTLLEKNILKTNKLRFNPMIVNQHYEIIDGQHRLDVAERNNLPIYFVIDNDSKIDDMMMIQAAKGWISKDYVHYFATRGYPVYQFMQAIVEEYKISITTFIRQFCSGGGCRRDKIFKSGEITLSFRGDIITKYMDSFAAVRTECLKYIPDGLLHSELEQSLIRIVREPKISTSEFIKNINLHPDKLLIAMAFKKRSNIVAELLKIYNHSRRLGKIHIDMG